MERVFAKYRNFKNVAESLLEDETIIFRKLLSQGNVHVFDAENIDENDYALGHRLNIGVYNDASKVLEPNSINSIYIDENLSESIIRTQLMFFFDQRGALLDSAFGLNPDKYDDFKKGVVELKKIENVLGKVHDEHVPLRSFIFNNISFYSKYLVGESLGGDYFDVEEINKKVFLCMASFNSYVNSVGFIRECEIIKGSGGDIIGKFKNYVSNNKEGINSILIFEITPKNLQYRYFSQGPCFFYSEIEEEGFLREGQRLFFGSQGFNSLLDLTNVDRELLGSGIPIKEIFNDTFVGLNGLKEGRFLPTDATMICLEVSKNTIKEV